MQMRRKCEPGIGRQQFARGVAAASADKSIEVIVMRLQSMAFRVFDSADERLQRSLAARPGPCRLKSAARVEASHGVAVEQFIWIVGQLDQPGTFEQFTHAGISRCCVDRSAGQQQKQHDDAREMPAAHEPSWLLQLRLSPSSGDRQVSAAYRARCRSSITARATCGRSAGQPKLRPSRPCRSACSGFT